MWYWVKSPAGQESDYNLEELKRALAEGKVQPDWKARGNDESNWTTVGAIAVEAGTEEDLKKYASLACGRCKNPLRIELPIVEGAYKCPRCGTTYHASKAAEEPLVYVLMPEFDKPPG